jgi:hypothetical protein
MVIGCSSLTLKLFSGGEKFPVASEKALSSVQNCSDLHAQTKRPPALFPCGAYIGTDLLLTRWW